MLNFLIGSGRCGSTLLYEVLARHSQVGFISNLDERLPFAPNFIRRLGSRLYRCTPGDFPAKRVRPCEGQRVLSKEVSPLVVDSFRDLMAADVTPWLAQGMRRFFEERAVAEGVEHYLHKFTGWPRALFLHEIFPEARFVHIVRDGRAVANSWLQMTWWRGHLGHSGWHFGPLPEVYRQEWEDAGRSMVHLAGIGWKTLMDAFTFARRSIPSHLWMEVRYEDLIADPRKQIDVILEFLGLPWTADFERRFARYTFSVSRTDAFRRNLTPDQLALLNRSLADHLHAFGYSA
ncbi:sulfotransferase family protein [Nonomuraea pusilla]|uniref:Sulfotransferase family protein n=1 Tax=Nonomuraea pusilla TaxID=46177 RepID=A0A1H7FD19_9ACTN|nr:sulfotransferase [Nonomuraea pusilla]SEK21940.1 Sulfotransferase family protein [Nonomuraea pusilla]